MPDESANKFDVFGSAGHRRLKAPEQRFQADAVFAVPNIAGTADE